MAAKRNSHRNANRMMQTGPYLAAALVAEMILVEERDQVHSVIRIVDRMSIPSEAAQVPTKEGDIVLLPLKAFFAIKAGKFSGECVMTVYQISPSGRQELLSIGNSQTLIFPRDTPDSGFNLQMPIHLKWDGVGQYWFEIRLDEIPFGRVGLYVAIGELPVTKKATISPTKSKE